MVNYPIFLMKIIDGLPLKIDTHIHVQTSKNKSVNQCASFCKIFYFHLCYPFYTYMSFQYIYIYIYVNIYSNIYIYIYIFTYMYIYIFIYILIFINIFMCIFILLVIYFLSFYSFIY